MDFRWSVLAYVAKKKKKMFFCHLEKSRAVECEDGVLTVHVRAYRELRRSRGPPGFRLFTASRDYAWPTVPPLLALPFLKRALVLQKSHRKSPLLPRETHYHSPQVAMTLS